MVISWKELRRVPSELLQNRLETVKSLVDDPLELYEVAKDKETGEHYLHYAYLHKQIAALGPEKTGEETYHHLMPLESDDVLGIIFGEQEYTFPDAWGKPFLRNGPDGDYVWYDPSFTEEEEDHEAMGQSLKDQLVNFRQSTEMTEESVRKLLEELDRTFGKDPSQ